MPLLRPSSSTIRASRCLAHTNHHTLTTLPSSGSGSISGTSSRSKALTPTASRAALFSSTSQAAAAADHAHEDAAHNHEEDHYDPPGGWLWGVKPGEKYQKEGWEGLWVWGFFGGLGLGVVAYAFKPDTSIQTWALEEARRRLEAEGILKEPDAKS